MNILVATNHLDRLGGSETFTCTLVEELRKEHNVDVFTLLKGDLMETVEPKPEYDLILINHNTCLEALKDIKGFKIYTCHGIYPDIEQPKAGADAYVAISEEIYDHIRDFKPVLIRNGIDCERFSPKKPLRKSVNRILSMCHGKEATALVKQACEDLEIEFDSIDRDVLDVENRINEADLVVTLGRGAYESMACGRAVITYDNREYVGSTPIGDGIVEDWKRLAKNNFSGRALKRTFLLYELKEEILKYNPEMGEKNRAIALENFDITKQVKEYLKLKQ